MVKLGELSIINKTLFRKFRYNILLRAVNSKTQHPDQTLTDRLILTEWRSHLPHVQGGGSCKHHPSVSGGLSVKHSHSMRDQTSHMKEKYQARYQHRRLSIRTPTGSNNNTPKVRREGGRDMRTSESVWTDVRHCISRELNLMLN